MKRDVMSVRLWLPRIEVLGVIVDAPGELVVRVASTVRRPWCPDCGTPSGKVHDRRDNKVRDLEVSGRPVTLIWERRGGWCASRAAAVSVRAIRGSRVASRRVWPAGWSKTPVR